MPSTLRLVRDDEDRLSVAPAHFPAVSSSRVVPFVAVSVRAQEDLRRRTKKIRELAERNPRGADLVEAFLDNLLKYGA